MFIFPLVTCAILATVLMIFVPTRRNKKVFHAFILLSLCTLWWHGSWVFLFLSTEQDVAEKIAVFGHIGILYLPLAYRKLYSEIIGAESSNRVLNFLYFVLLSLLLFTNTVIDGVNHFPWGFYPKAGLLHPLFIAIIFYVVMRSIIDSARAIREISDSGRRKAITIGIVACLVFSLGSVDFLINYKLTSIYPLGFLSSILFVLLNAVGIVRHDLYQGDFLVKDLREKNDSLQGNVERKTLEIQEKEKLIEQILHQVNELQIRDNIISSFVSPAVRREVASGENPLQYKPQKILLTVVFIDMRNFTGFAESQVLEEVFSLVNKYFDIVNRSVYSNGGEVNKYLGDGVLGLFSNPSDCLRAIAGFLRELEEFNSQRRKSFRQEIEIGVGISFGEVLSGNFGSETKLERSVIGDVVNTAARLEQLTKTYSCQVVADESFIKEVPEYAYSRPIGVELLKGKSKPVPIYEIFESSPLHEVKYKLASKDTLDNAIAKYRAGSLQDAVDILNSFGSLQCDHDVVFARLREAIEGTSGLDSDKKSA